MSDKDIEALRKQWTQLYAHTLPDLAKNRDSAQPRWPVVLDHCFARIILDNAVGIDKPWHMAIKAPAVKNMTALQLRAAFDLGQAIARGDSDLVDLDNISLAMRGKTKGPKAGTATTVKKRSLSASSAEESSPARDDTAPPTKKQQTRKGHYADLWARYSADDKASTILEKPAKPATPWREPFPSLELGAMRARIASDTSLTPFRRRVLTLLTQVPRGRYTTYKALADGVAAGNGGGGGGDGGGRGCARAIGSAMRNNPFAPTVPCHRVLAASGKLGGFGGDWGEEGRFAAEKRRLLKEEGVRFDGKGKVVGAPFTGFV